MRSWRRRRGRNEPELETGLVVLTTGGRWRVLDANAGIPAQPPPELAEIGGAALAEAFRRSWVRAQAGARRVRGLDEWIRAAPVDAGGEPRTGDAPSGEPGDPAAAWRGFFLGGGVLFSVRTARAEGITAVRCCWVWPAAGRERVHAGTRPGDRLAITGPDDWQPLAHDAAAWQGAPMWTEAAAWLRSKAGVDSRCSTWWVAGEDGAPDLAVADPIEAQEALREWWSGKAATGGEEAARRYRLGEPVDQLWLRWEPRDAPRPDGLAALLGLRRTGGGVDVSWWDIAPGGAPAGPWRAAGPEGLSIGEAEELVLRTIVGRQRPTTVEWIRAGPSG